MTNENTETPTKEQLIKTATEQRDFTESAFALLVKDANAAGLKINIRPQGDVINLVLVEIVER